MGFLFAVLTASAQGQSFGGGISRGAVKPAGNDRPGTQRTGFARQNNENRLRNLLRQMRVTNLAQRHGIDQVDMPRHQGGERLFGFESCILPHEVQVIDHHSIYTSPPAQKSNSISAPSTGDHKKPAFQPYEGKPQAMTETAFLTLARNRSCLLHEDHHGSRFASALNESRSGLEGQGRSFSHPRFEASR